MTKYINADKFVTKLDTMKNPDSEFVTDDYIDGFSDGVSYAMKEIMEMPDADITEVVRCKDCKYYRELYKLCGCRHDKRNVYINKDDYCSFGERRE